MRLIPEWKRAHRLWSVRIAGFLSFVALSWEQIPPEFKAIIPPGWLPYLVAGAAMANLIARLIKQGLPK